MKGQEVKDLTPCLPTRHVLAFLTMCAFFTTQTAQLSLNMAIVAMVHPSIWNVPADSKTQTGDYCPKPDDNNTKSSEDMPGEFMWDAQTQGMILGAMFYGSIVTHVVGGRLAERLGGKWLFGASILLPALLCFVLPTAARLGPYYIFAVRVLQGLAEGVMGPTYFALLSVWAPAKERNTMASIGLLGTLLGSATTMVLTGIISSHASLGGWPAVFYMSGVLGCIWFLFWTLLVHNTPEEHPRIRSDELIHIRESLNQESLLKEESPVPWRKVLCSGPFWSYLLVRTVLSWETNTSNSALPLYLNTVLHLPLEKNGVIMSLMYPSSVTGCLLGGLLADQIRRRTKIRATFMHKGFALIGIGLSTVCWILVPEAQCDVLWVFILLLSTKFFHMLCIGSVQVALVDMAPQYAGTLSGIMYTTMDCTGFLSPMLTGALTEVNVSIQQWSYVIYVNAGLLLLGLVIFTAFGSAERQSWAQGDTTEKTPLMSEPVSKTIKIPF